MRQCADFRAQMIAYVRGELLPLERAHIESHVARCRSCASLERKTARTFEAVDRWTPAAEPVHLARLKKRLEPYVADAAPNRPLWPVVLPAGALAAAAAAIVAVTMWLAPRADERAAEAEALADAPAAIEERAIAEPFQPVEAVLHREIGRHLRVIAGRGWDGRVLSGEPEDMRLEMQKGFAVMAFRGGEGRRLTVLAPNVSVEVIGTKFFVHVLANGATAVGVVSGSVRVTHAGGSELVEAGTSRAYGAEGAPEPAPSSAVPSIDLEDEFIADHGHGGEVAPGAPGSEPRLAPDPDPDARAVAVADRAAEAKLAPRAELALEAARRTPAPKSPEAELEAARTAPAEGDAKAAELEPARGAAPKTETATAESGADPDPEADAENEPEPAAERVNLGALLAEAERLVKKGRVDEALAIYEGALASEDEAILAHRSLVRYELARLLGFEKNEASRARAIFEHLTITADGEVETQAAFALCELDLVASPCAAARCLRSIARDPSVSGDVHAEAELLLARWQIARCDHN